MTIEESKNIKLADYLHSLGYNPIKQQGNSLLVQITVERGTGAFFQSEHRPQFIGMTFGAGKGGNILCIWHRNFYASDSLPYLFRPYSGAKPLYPSRFFFLFASSHQPNRVFQHLETVSLSSPALFAYLQDRGINTALAKKRMYGSPFLA